MEYMYHGEEVELVVGFYQNNNQAALYLLDEEGQIITTLTTNIDWVDTHCVGIRSDDRHNAEWLYDQGLLETGEPAYGIPSGFITIEFYQISDQLRGMIAEAKDES